MNKSESIEELAAALSKFQGEISNVYKGTKGYSWRYADLAAILDDVRPLLSKYGLSVTQLAGNSGDSVSVETVLLHQSGQWLSETIQMPVDLGKGMSRAQAIGSVISYARRYSLSSCLGIAQTDDDASLKKEEPAQRYEDTGAKIKAELKEKIDKETGEISPDLLTRMEELIVEMKVPIETIQAWCDKAKVDTIDKLTSEQIRKVIAQLEKQKESK